MRRVRRLASWLSAKEWHYLLIFVATACLFLWPLVLHPGWLPARAGSQESDLLLTHLPNADYWRTALADFHQWPLWNDQILAGQPFAADPLAGLWYPPNWLLLLPGPGLPVLFNLLFILHLAWAGYGLFRLLRAEGLAVGPAFFAGLAFTGTPKLVAHLGAGHVSLVFAVAWTPWLLLAIRRLITTASPRAGAQAGLALALLFLADVRWSFYAALLGFAFGLALWRPWARPAAAARPPLRAMLVAGATAVCVFFLLSAVLLVPLLELLHYSNRAALTLDEAGAYSLPPLPYLLGLAIPLYGVIHEWVTYAGIATLILALMGLRRRPFWLAAAVVAGAFALGTNFFFFPFLFRWLPGVSLLRVPARAWFVVSLAECALAAYGLERLLVLWRNSPAGRRYPALLLPALMLLTSIDLLWMDHSVLVARPLPPAAPAAQWLAEQPGLFRVYSSSGSLPLPDTLQHVEGVDPLYLSALADDVARATHITASGYSVSVPPIFTADAGQTPLPDAQLLGRLNVRYVAAAFDVPAPGLRLVRQFGVTRVYENELARPRAWLDGGSAEVEYWSPNQITVSAAGPGQLILSEVAYPGWQVHVDGRLVPLETVDNLLRAATVGPGQHTVTFEFRPVSVYTGLLLTLIGSGLCLWLCLRRH